MISERTILKTIFDSDCHEMSLKSHRAVVAAQKGDKGQLCAIRLANLKPS